MKEELLSPHEVTLFIARHAHWIFELNGKFNHLQKEFNQMAANQSQVLQALTGLKSSVDTLKTQIQNQLQSGSGAPDEQPVLDQVTAIQDEVTGLIALMPSASAPAQGNTAGQPAPAAKAAPAEEAS